MTAPAIRSIRVLCDDGATHAYGSRRASLNALRAHLAENSGTEFKHWDSLARDWWQIGTELGVRTLRETSSEIDCVLCASGRWAL